MLVDYELRERLNISIKNTTVSVKLLPNETLIKFKGISQANAFQDWMLMNGKGLFQQWVDVNGWVYEERDE